MQLAKKIGGGSYSTSEVDTGETWIDGKKIYRKVVQIASLPNATEGAYAHGISNIDNCWIANGSYFYINSTWLPVPYTHPTANLSIYVGITLTNIIINVAVDRTNMSAVVVIEYTKTSD